MDLTKFRATLETDFFSKLNKLEKLNDIPGYNSARIQHLLNIAVRCLEGTNEAYFEVGCYNGSSLAAASQTNDLIQKYACDIKTTSILKATLNGIPNIKFVEEDFFKLDLVSFLEHPISIFYYDGFHEYEATVNALTKIEPFLADKALIFIDDLDGFSRVYNAWRDFFKRPENVDRWTIVHEFYTPDRFLSVTKGCPDSWWNGFGIAEFERVPERPSQLIEWISMQVYKGNPPYKNRKGTLWPAEFKHIHGKEEANDSDL